MISLVRYNRYSNYRAIFILLILASALSCAASAPEPRPLAAPGKADNRLDAILWQTTSAEYRVLAQMIYATAEAQLERALGDGQWSALPSQKDNYQNLPPAIIMDIDETVVDTGGFQSQMARHQSRFSSRPWREWQARNLVAAVPGAVEFIAAAQARGVTIFFVTNRDHPTEAVTRLNLTSIGIKLPSDLDTVLCRDERPDWGSDKESRRRFIAQSYRVLMLFGDDLADFISEFRASPAQRRADASKHNLWGTKWFMLPNPMYGSWEMSLYEFRNELSSEEQSKRKFDQLP